MNRRLWKRGLAAALGLILSVQAPGTPLMPALQTYAYTERSATINASSLNVRSGPGTGNSAVAKLARGTAVTVTNETTGSDGKLWYQIRFTANGKTSTGYVLGTYVSFPVAYSHNADFEAYLTAQGFPESYKNGLRQLHAQYPNWVFEAYKTNLDWSTAVQNEMVLPRSLVHTNSISSYKSLADGAYNWDTSTWTGFDGSTWVAASEGLLCYYMDPRNFLDSVYIFQFLSHEYDGNLHTKDGLQAVLKGTFLEKGVITNGSASGSTGNGSGGTSSGSTSSGGPGVSSGGPGVVSGGVIVSPSGGTGSKTGTSSGTGPSVSGSPSSGGASSGVELTAPQASISKRKTELVASSVVVGAMPGAGDQSSGSAPQAGNSSPTSNSPGGGSSTVVAGSSGSQGSSSTPGGSSSPVSQSSDSYADMIMKAAAESGVNPYVLAAMIIQEQGSGGTGRSISGSVSGYAGYYNYFNVGAYADNGMSAVERGLWYASQSGSYGRPWNTPEKSIIGGAQFYGTNYVSAGQDTFYLKKYNVQGSNMYKHQYMTNVNGAAEEASLFAEAYSDNLKQTALRFKIPVYNNMPDTPCAKPTGDGSPNNKLGGLGAEGFVLTPTFNRDTTSYDLIVDYSVSNVSIYANVLDSTASVSGVGNIQLQSGSNEIRVQVKAQNGDVREYVIHVVRQNNGPTYNGSIGGSSSGTGSVTPGGSSTPAANPGGSNAYGPGVSAGPGVSSTPSTGGSGVITSGSGGTSSTPGGSNVTVVSPAG